MGIITDPNTLIANTLAKAAEVEAKVDTIYAEFNGNIDNANIKAGAAIVQSKIAALVSDLVARVVKAGDQMTGRLDIKMVEPHVRFIGTEPAAKDWRLAEGAGSVFLQENTGTEGSPTWTVRYQFRTPNTPTADDDVATKKYVNDQDNLAIFTKEFISAEQTLTLNGTLTLAHGLGVKPKMLYLVMVNKVAELGYSVGDESHLYIMMDASSRSIVPVINNADTTNIFIKFGGNTVELNRKDTGLKDQTIYANWKLVVKAWA